MQDYGLVSIIIPIWGVQAVYKLVYVSVCKC